jgi:hypothetical protein
VVKVVEARRKSAINFSRPPAVKKEKSKDLSEQNKAPVVVSGRRIQLRGTSRETNRNNQSQNQNQIQPESDKAAQHLSHMI